MALRRGASGVIALVAAACSPAPDPERNAGTGGGDSIGPLAALQETIAVGGALERIDAFAFRPPVGFPIAFSTVVPADMEVEFENSGRGDVVRFVAAFGGLRRPEATLSFVVLPRGTDSTEAKARFEEQATDARGRAVESHPDDWAVQRVQRGDGSSGFLALSRHETVWFYLDGHYPPELGDKVVPRIDLILRRWNWTGTGTMLWHREGPETGLISWHDREE